MQRGSVMTRRARARSVDDRETAGAIDFDAALEAYLYDGDPEELLRAAGLVVGSTLPLEPERAEAIAKLTGTTASLPTMTMQAAPFGAGSP